MATVWCILLSGRIIHICRWFRANPTSGSEDVGGPNPCNFQPLHSRLLWLHSCLCCGITRMLQCCHYCVAHSAVVFGGQFPVCISHHIYTICKIRSNLILVLLIIMALQPCEQCRTHSVFGMSMHACIGVH